jgi:hypothetical protein
MKASIAERKLLFSQKGSAKRTELFVRVSAPYVVVQGTVNFPVGDGIAGCSVSFEGLDDEPTNEIYGADTVQALELAVSMIEPFLKRLSSRYDIYFPTGENYFEPEDFE